MDGVIIVIYFIIVITALQHVSAVVVRLKHQVV